MSGLGFRVQGLEVSVYWRYVGIRWELNRDYIGRTPIVESPMEQKNQK